MEYKHGRDFRKEIAQELGDKNRSTLARTARPPDPI
jgi:hypothetical protein